MVEGGEFGNYGRDWDDVPAVAAAPPSPVGRRTLWVWPSVSTRASD